MNGLGSSRKVWGVGRWVSKQVAETWLMLPVSCGHLSNYYLCCQANPQSRAANSGEKSLEYFTVGLPSPGFTRRHGPVSLAEREKRSPHLFDSKILILERKKNLARGRQSTLSISDYYFIILRTFQCFHQAFNVNKNAWLKCE